jgi:transcriptional regulator with XRE-family HTH domain
LPSFIQVIRVAQGISQRSIASGLGVHQSSVAQFETGRSKLSLETLARMASLLNLNRAFIERGTGSPFKPRKPGEAIKLLISPKPESGPDLYLLNLILTRSEQARITILLPPLDQARGKLGMPGFYYAIAIRDDRGIAYLLRAKDSKKLTGSVSELQAEIDGIALRGRRNFHCEVVRISGEMFEKLRNWSIRRADELSSLLPKTRKVASRQVLLRLVDTIFSDQKENEAIRNAVAVIDREEIEIIVDRLKTELRSLLSRNSSNTDKIKV